LRAFGVDALAHGYQADAGKGQALIEVQRIGKFASESCPLPGNDCDAPPAIRALKKAGEQIRRAGGPAESRPLSRSAIVKLLNDLDAAPHSIPEIFGNDALLGDVFDDWLTQLADAHTQAKIATRINRLAAGNFGACKSLRLGLYELRIDWGPGYRVYYAMIGNECVLLKC